MRTVLLAVVLVLSGNAINLAEEKSLSGMAFERLKGLAGTWEVTEKSTSRKFTAEYTLTGGDSVLMEVLAGMATAYHLDKGTLVLTHFCGAGNQPRMRVKAIENGGRRIAFEMYDITNLKSPDAYRSTSLEVQFHDDGTVDLAYGGWSAGRSSTQTFQLLRRTTPSAFRVVPFGVSSRVPARALREPRALPRYPPACRPRMRGAREFDPRTGPRR